jgi:hypothetical protein
MEKTLDKSFTGSETDKQILELSMSFDEKLNVNETPVSAELVQRLINIVVALDKEVKTIKKAL